MPTPTQQTSPLGMATPEDDQYVQEVRASRKALQEALANRQQLFDPTLLAIAQGFLAPTRSGGFGESLSNVAGQLAPVQEAEQRRAMQMAQLRAEMATQELGERQASRRQQLAGKVYRSGESGELEMDPQAAMEYARATGDLKFMEQASAAQRQQRLRQAARGMFIDREIEDDQGRRTVTSFNPQAALQVARMSDDPVKAVAQYAEMVPKLRKAGLLEGLSPDTSTPFDAIVLMADSLGKQGPALKEQAKRLAEQYRKGYIDEDKANTLANQLFTTANSSVDRQTAQANQQIMQGLMLGMRQQSLDFERQRELEKREAERRERELKLTDEQKAVFKSIVIPSQQEAAKAANGLLQVQQLRNVIESAPSGTFSGALASSVGRLFGTDDNTALRQLDSLSKALIPMIPRLPGAASNLDAQNLEKSIGRLNDITLTNQQRRDLVKEIDEGMRRLVDRADAIQRSWDSTKTVPTSVLAPLPPEQTQGQRPAQPGGFRIIGTEPARRP